MPTEAEIAEKMTRELINAMLNEYTKKGWQIHVRTASHNIEKTLVSEWWDKWNVHWQKWRYTGSSWIEYYTDHDADVGSPIDPGTAAIITAILVFLGIVVKTAFLWHVFNIIDRKLEDMTSGLDEIIPGAGGIGLFVIIVLLLVVGVLFFLRR